MDDKHLKILYDSNFELLENYRYNEYSDVSSEANLDSFLLEYNATNSEEKDNLNEESLTSKLAFKAGKKEAVDAVISSRERHLAQNDSRETNNPDVFRKLRALTRKLSDDKVMHLVNLVKAADKTDNRISIDIRDDDGFAKNTNSLTADFDGETHMSLHTIKGEHPLLDQEREGRQQSTGYGENDKFIRDITGKNLKKLVTDKYESDLHKIGLLESLSTPLSKSDTTSIFSLPLSKIAGFSYNEIKNDLKERGSDIDPSKYVIPSSDKHLSLNSMKMFIVSNGTKEDKEKVLEKIASIKEKSEKAIDADKGMTISFGTVFSIYSIYKRIRDKKALKESEFSDDLTAIYGNFFMDDLELDLEPLLECLHPVNEMIMPELDDRTITIDKAIENNSPISDVLNQVKDIVYGFINKQNGERIVDREWIHNCDDLKQYYSTNYDPEITLKNKLGICLDQSLAIRYLMNKLHPDYKVQIYALMKGRFGHAVPCYCDPENKWYYLENAWDKERGLHGGFDSQKELEDYLSMVYHRHHDKDNNDEVTVMPYEKYESLTESVIYSTVLKEINLI